MKQTLNILLAWYAGISLALAAAVPDELESTRFAGPDLVPSPACLCAAPTGEIFVGVDMNGSLAKEPGKGKIVRLVDTDHDGAADVHTVFAEVDNPRGLIAIGHKLYVLHTVIPPDTGILTGVHLSLFTDADGDGVADGPPERLVSEVSPPKHNQDRGADHTTNGIALGIDGWIYIAVGDFGMAGAKGSDGTELTMLGGGIVRVRPDGSELEVYTHGTRNIYDVAIDPFLNLYTRGNTNDGGGWNVRFIHHIQSGEYGYPTLFKNFTGEILPALEDLGGGSGTGALFFAEPGWPKAYTNVPMMADWGRSHLFIHRLTPDGPSFTQKPEEFMSVSQISDVDVDGSGRMYVSAWDGAGYKGSDQKGYIERVVPKGWTRAAFPDLSQASDADLVEILKRPSAVARLHAQQVLLARQAEAKPVLALARDPGQSLESRVAAIFTAKQLGVSNPALAELAGDAPIREWVLRALADRRTRLEDVPLALLRDGLRDNNPRVRVAAAVALGRLGDVRAAEDLLTVANPPANTYQPQPEAAAVAQPAVTSKKLKPFHQEKIAVDVSDWKELHLVVTDGGDGNSLDHAAWWEPVLVLADGSEQKLTDLAWKSAKGGWGKTLVDRDCQGQPLARALDPGREPGKERKLEPTGIGTHSPSHIVYELPEDAVRFKATVAATAGAMAGRGYAEYVVNSTKPGFAEQVEGPHATPHSAIVLPHVAVQSLVKLNAVDACLTALDGPQRPAALWTLRYLHEPKVVDAVLERFDAETNDERRRELLALMGRLYQKEAPYDGSWWWSTRPDTRGPAYKLAPWEKSEAIAAAMRREYLAANDQTKHALKFWNKKLRMGFEEMAVADAEEKTMDEPQVDFAKIYGGEAGEVGRTSIEDVILALDNLKGDNDHGEKLFTQQGCIACHTTNGDQPLKGPYMGQVGAILSRDQIAESILKPNASISQGFATVMMTTKDGASYTGFISAETADEIEMRDIAGQVHRIKAENVAQRQELEMSMMPPGLTNTLSLKDFASLIEFLVNRKG